MRLEQHQLVYGGFADSPGEWGEAERIAGRVASIHDVRAFSGADWVWETLAVLEAEGTLAAKPKREDELKARLDAS